jgi:hypothetical protein
MTDSPWMTTQETAGYARVHENTVYRALKACVSSGGSRGLRGYQRGSDSPWRIHRDDADRWLRGESPSRGNRKLAQVARSA